MMSRHTARAPRPVCARSVIRAGGEGAGHAMVATHRPFRPLIAAVAALVIASHAAAQTPQRDVYTRQTLIRVPFTPDSSGKLKRVLLYVSTDSGRDWQP